MINRIYIWLGFLSAFLLSLSAIFLRGKSEGRKQTEAKNNEQTIREQRAIIEASKPVSVDDLVERLREGKF